MNAGQWRDIILSYTAHYHGEAFPWRPFRPGVDPVPVSGKVLDADDLKALVDASLDGWLTAGPHAARFEREFAAFMGLRCCSLVNSGSSANLLALTALTSPKLNDRRLRPGDEVITCAVGFPTTVNPILQNGLVPVFVDCDETYNLDVERLETAWSKKTRAIMTAHTLGNPFHAWLVEQIYSNWDLYLVADCCDAAGAEFEGIGVAEYCDLATVSFYPAHHMTTGEGGAVLTDSPALQKVVESYRDWGRACWCEPGKDNTCGKRFGWDVEGMPAGYDHKYTYEHQGYNLKATDLQAALGCSQLKKLPGFIEARRRNHATLLAGCKDLEEFFVLPKATPGSNPSWFGFALMVREDAPFTRADVVRRLEERKIATRPIFGGNLTRQPAYRGANYRVAGSLQNADAAMERAFWLGVWPGLTVEMLGYVLETLHEFCQEAKR